MIRSSSKVVDKSSVSIDPSQVVRKGTGPKTVVFLHGLFGTPEHWMDVMENLSDEYDVLAPQLPIDRHPNRRWHGAESIRDLSDVVAEYIDSLNLDQFVLCGNSLGGLIAIDLCIQNPDYATGLVLAGSAGLFERSPIRGLRSRPSKKFVRETVSGILYDKTLITDGLVDEWYQSMMDRDYVRFILRMSRATRDRCVEDELGDLDLPTMIVWGKEDGITPPSVAREFQSRISGSQLRFIDNCGHAPNWERPDTFAETLRAFLPSRFA